MNTTMHWRGRPFVNISVLLLLCGALQAGGLEKCVGSDGSVEYTDSGCSTKQSAASVQISDSQGLGGLRDSERSAYRLVREKERMHNWRPVPPQQQKQKYTKLQQCYSSRKLFSHAVNEANRNGTFDSYSGTCVTHKIPR